MKIASHNSGTGESSRGFKDKLLIPFARCQSKTLLQQYEVGCRLFDIRINKNGYLAHGLWESSKKASTALYELDSIGDRSIYVILTFEGNLKDMNTSWFLNLKRKLNNIQVVSICCKKPRWKTIYGFIFMEWKKEFSSATWRKWLPIPWLWSKFKKKMSCNDEFVMMDFI